MKIVFLNKYQNRIYRGAETFVAELAKRLSKNYEVEIVSDVNYFKLFAKRFDIIIPTNGRLQALIVRLIAWLKGAKLVISGQSGIGLDDRINLYVFPNIFVAISSKAKLWARKTNPLVKSVYIPNGVDLSKFKPKKLSSVNGSLSTILSVGAFTREKRHDLTIKAVAKLKDVKLVIVGGGGDLKKEIEKLGGSLLTDRFEIISIKHSQMPKIYQKADLFTFSTVPWESFGIVVLEAMASGLPVVATDDPIRREIVGDAGMFVDPTDTEAYSKVLKKALNTNWGNRPRRQAKKFDWDTIAKKYEELFSKLI